ncbi:MAG TPA: Crp/Fnr family transcriptional regulator, partial [Sphingomonadales bacterium]|nr:Crp/Fnr family transcriptional regulator [Sphingomonadales bacterium]
GREAALRAPLALVSKEARCRNCERRPVSICAIFTCEELDRLDAIMVSKSFAPDETIFHQGDVLTHFATISEGVARAVHLLPDGRRTIVDFLAVGNFFGLSPEGRYPYTAEAVTAARLCCYPRAKFAVLLREFPKLETRLLEIFQAKLVESQNRAAELARKLPPERLASFLLGLAARPSFARGGGLVCLPMGREDIADYLGLTIETVSRIFTRFKTEGLIVLETRGRVRLADEAALRALAKG